VNLLEAELEAEPSTVCVCITQAATTYLSAILIAVADLDFTIILFSSRRRGRRGS
jgi:hypothetical protein